MFMCSYKEHFAFRIDAVPSDGGVNLHVWLPLQNCTKYMSVIDKMPEHVRRQMRCNDCKR